MKIIVSGSTDRGKCREINEDSYIILEEQRLFAVADGVGGQNAGDIASNLAINQLSKFFIMEKPEDKAEVKAFFDHFINETNKMINDEAKIKKDSRGMATTLVMLMIHEDLAFISNVGDSRAYLLRDGELRQLTEDHSYVNELVKKGSITAEEAKNHPNKNLITRALGAPIDTSADFYEQKLQPDDWLLLCTDGLSNELDDEIIENILNIEETPAEAADSLIKKANENGGRDNITVICIKVIDNK